MQIKAAKSIWAWKKMLYFVNKSGGENNIIAISGVPVAIRTLLATNINLPEKSLLINSERVMTKIGSDMCSKVLKYFH